MEHKINEIITYNYRGKTIQLEVTPAKDSSCLDCFFYNNYDCDYCFNIRDFIGQCDNKLRTDNIHIIFKKVIKKTVDSNK